MSLFALKTLLADRGKLLVALVGVVFSLVLVNVQGGLYVGLIGKASLLIDHTDADIWVGRWGIENIDLPGNIPEAWFDRIRGVRGVERAETYVVGGSLLSAQTGDFEVVWIVGSEPDSTLAGRWDTVAGDWNDLRQPSAIAIDALDDKKLGMPRIGDLVELNGHRARVVAKTAGVQNFMTTPMVFSTLEPARRFTAVPEGFCSYFLIKAAKDADIGGLRKGIQFLIPEADVYTRDEFRKLSKDYWMKRTGIGISFGAATALGLMVGLLMVAQSLYALALDHLAEYATLKAMGADDRQVFSVVILQSLAIGTFGSCIGVALVLGIQRFGSNPMAPIVIPPVLLCGGVVLVFGICLFSVILPWLRIRRTDPAMVLQG